MQEIKNITCLEEWKSKRETASRKECLTEYLSILNFNELITESSTIISELKNNHLNTELTLRSKLILKEFNNRLSKESERYTESLRPLHKQIEKKITDLNKLL